MPSAGAYDWLDDAIDDDGEQPTLRAEPPVAPPGAPPVKPAASAGQSETPQFVNPRTGDPEVGMFIRATDVQWAKLVELGVTSMRKLIDYLAATDASARCNGAPAGVPVVLKRSLFNWCRDSGRQVHLEIEAAVACGYLIQGGVAPYEWLHCCPPGGVQTPPAAQIAATAAGRDRSMYKSRLCRNWLQWGTTPSHTHTPTHLHTHTHTPTHPYTHPILPLTARATHALPYSLPCALCSRAEPPPPWTRQAAAGTRSAASLPTVRRLDPHTPERRGKKGVGWLGGGPRIGCGGQLPPSPSAPGRPPLDPHSPPLWPLTPRASCPLTPRPFAPVQASQSSVGLPPCTSTGASLTRCSPR